MSIIFFIILFNLAFSRKLVELTTDNLILVKNEINAETVSYAIDKLQSSKNTSKNYIFIDSFGGSVEDGVNLINEIQKHNITCIAQRAYSMAFAILQSCKNRYMLPSGKLMQHQMSFGIQNSLLQVYSYISYVSQMNNYLTELQSKKIRIDRELFIRKTSTDWWLFGESAVFNNVVDELVDVKCSKTLINSNYTQMYHGSKYTYSNCPIIYKEKDKEQKEKFFLFI